MDGICYIALGETRTHNLLIRSQTRYPIAPLGHLNAPCRDRTDDLVVNSHTLYPTELTEQLMLGVGFEPTRANTEGLKSSPLDHSGIQAC